MKNIIFISLFATFLLAGNPNVYSALGNDVYNNVDKITNLQNVKLYEKQILDIALYRSEVMQTKSYGYEIENGKGSIGKLEYLKYIRTLSKRSDNYIRGAKKHFKESIREENSQLFSQLVNTGIIDTVRYKDEIINYYMFHAEDINSSGVIQDMLDADELERKRRERKIKYYKSKKELQREKIKRIRENDKKKQAAIEHALQKEVERKKVEIRENQKRELSL